MKFMHLADVHLGAVPDAGNAWSELRAREIWDTFRDTIADAAREKVDLLLIAGDLFHRAPKWEELEEVNYLFSTLPSTRVVLIAGNHDHLTPDCAYMAFPWNRNVVCLFTDSCECVRFPEIKTEVYGFSYDRQMIPEALCDDLRPERNHYLHILLAHGGDAQHIPMGKEVLAASGFDYIALGHIHRPGALIAKKAVYSGALEPIDCMDVGPHGYILGTFNGKRPDLTFVEKAKRQYREMEILCGEEDTTYALADRIAEQIASEGPEHIYRILLRGTRPAGYRFDEKRLLQSGGMIVDVKDETESSFHLEELLYQYRGQIIGRYIESFQDAQPGSVEEKALKAGLEALLKSLKE